MNYTYNSGPSRRSFWRPPQTPVSGFPTPPRGENPTRPTSPLPSWGGGFFPGKVTPLDPNNNYYQQMRFNNALTQRNRLQGAIANDAALNGALASYHPIKTTQPVGTVTPIGGDNASAYTGNTDAVANALKKYQGDGYVWGMGEGVLEMDRRLAGENPNAVRVKPAMPTDTGSPSEAMIAGNSDNTAIQSKIAGRVSAQPVGTVTPISTQPTSTQADTFDWNQQNNSALTQAQNEYDAWYQAAQGNTSAQASMIEAARARALESLKPQLAQNQSTLRASIAERGALDTSGFGQMLNEVGQAYNRQVSDANASYTDQINNLYASLAANATGERAKMSSRASDIAQNAYQNYLSKYGIDTQAQTSRYGVDKTYDTENRRIDVQDKQFWAQYGLDSAKNAAEINAINANIADINTDNERDNATLTATILTSMISAGLNIADTFKGLSTKAKTQIKNALTGGISSLTALFNSWKASGVPTDTGDGRYYYEKGDSDWGGGWETWKDANFDQAERFQKWQNDLEARRIAATEAANRLEADKFAWDKTHDPQTGLPIDDSKWGRFTSLLSQNMLDSNPDAPGVQRELSPSQLINIGKSDYGIDIVGLARQGDTAAISALRNMYPRLSNMYPEASEFIDAIESTKALGGGGYTNPRAQGYVSQSANTTTTSSPSLNDLTWGQLSRLYDENPVAFSEWITQYDKNAGGGLRGMLYRAGATYGLGVGGFARKLNRAWQGKDVELPRSYR